MYILHTIPEWKKILMHSKEKPVLIFKHSNACGTSERAERRITEAVHELSISDDAYMVTVQRARQVSDAIEEDTRVKHETPQAIILFQGEPFYHLSHSDIQTKDLISKFGEIHALMHKS